MAEKESSTSMTEADYREEMDRLKNDISQLQSDVSELVGLLKSSASSKGDDFKNRFTRERDQLLDEMVDKLNEGVERGRQGFDEVGDRLGEHPVGTLFISFSLGYILAKIMERGGSSGKTG